MYFLTKTQRKQHFCIISVLIPVNKFRSVHQMLRSLRDVISARILGALRVYAYARMALAIMPTSHAEVIIRSHCYVIMTAQFLRQIGSNLRELDRAITQVIKCAQRMVPFCEQPLHAKMRQTENTQNSTSQVSREHNCPSCCYQTIVTLVLLTYFHIHNM